jgi:alkylation response protein AidB-like acyl-CoA dehydrogenase
MAVYSADLNDIQFTLFKVLKVQERSTAFSEGDLKDILEQFTKFVAGEIYPTRVEGDHVGVKLTPKGVVVPPSFKPLKEAFYANGWYGLGYPEDIGGIPAPQSVALACNGLAVGANVAFTMYYGLTQGCMNVILKVGSTEQKDKYVPMMMEGRWGGTMCLTEAGAGSDVGAGSSTAIPAGENLYKIKGTKIFISSGDNDLYENIIHLVLARTPGAPEGTKGLSLFIVPKMKIAADGTSLVPNGVVCSKVEEKMGIHGSATCVINFGQDGESLGEMIGKEGEGIQNMFIMMNEARLLCGMQGEAQANLAYEMTKKYAKERVQFGVEIEKHSDVRRMLLKMRSTSRALRALNYYVGDLIDRENAGDHGAGAELALLTPICKSMGSDEGFNVSVDAVQVHGGYGYCTEYEVEQFVRDTKIATIYEGTNGIQAIDFVMRKILKDQGKTFSLLAKKMVATLSTKEVQTQFASEAKMMGEHMEQAQKIVEHFGQCVMNKKANLVLQNANDFLWYCGSMVLNWRLMDAAVVALREKGQTPEEQAFLQTKIDDVRFFSRFVLPKNYGLARQILISDLDLLTTVI